MKLILMLLGLIFFQFASYRLDKHSLLYHKYQFLITLFTLAWLILACLTIFEFFKWINS